MGGDDMTVKRLGRKTSNEIPASLKRQPQKKVNINFAAWNNPNILDNPSDWSKWSKVVQNSGAGENQFGATYGKY